MEQRFGYRTDSNILECIGFLAGYIALWVMAIVTINEYQQANIALGVIGFLFLNQIFLLHPLSLLRLFRCEIVLTNDQLIASSPDGIIKIDLRDISAIETHPHILGAGRVVVAKSGEIRFNRRIGGFKELDRKLSEIVL